MSEWRECTLGDLCLDISYGFTASASLEEIGPHFLRITDIVSGRLNWDTIPYCEIDEEKRGKYFLDEGDIVIARTGASTGATYTWRVNDQSNTVFASYLIRYQLDKRQADPKFIGFLLRSRNWFLFVEGIKGGSAQPGANAKQFASYEISLPPLPEQRAIAAVLSALDDKIDLLQRQNRTLESLAQALFRHWLIDGAGADWEECSLYDAIELVGGGTPKTSEAEYWGGDIYWLSGGDIANNHKNFVVSSDKTITELGLQKSATKLLPQFSTVISARGTVGKYCLLAEPMAFSQTSYGVKPKFEHCFFFTYLLIDHSVTELLSAAYGSVFDTITIRTFQNQRICVPSEAEILSFEDQITPYFQRMKLNQIQIRTLASLRDTLLPKLMSGEVRVRG